MFFKKKTLWEKRYKTEGPLTPSTTSARIVVAAAVRMGALISFCMDELALFISIPIPLPLLLKIAVS